MSGGAIIEGFSIIISCHKTPITKSRVPKRARKSSEGLPRFTKVINEGRRPIQAVFSELYSLSFGVKNPFNDNLSLVYGRKKLGTNSHRNTLDSTFV